MFKLADANTNNETNKNSDWQWLTTIIRLLILLIKVFIGATTEIIVAT